MIIKNYAVCSNIDFNNNLTHACNPTIYCLQNCNIINGIDLHYFNSISEYFYKSTKTYIQNSYYK